MKKDRDIIQLLKEWLRGDAGYHKERELSDMAQDDPFLADALSGYQSFPEGDHEKQITRIRERLSNTKKRRVVPPIIWRVAAGGAILIAAIFALRWVNDSPLQPISQEMTQATPIEEEAIPAEKEREDLATLTEAKSDNKQADSFDDLQPAKPTTLSDNTPKEAKPKASTKEMDGHKARANKPTSANSASEKLESRVRAAAPARKEMRQDQGQVAEIVTEADEVTPASKVPGFVTEKKEIVIAEEGEAQLEAAPAPTSASAINLNARSEDILSRKISGLVTDENGEPLIGVNVSAAGKRIGTVTDLDGKFELPISDDEKEIQVAYTGYSPLHIPLIQNDTYNIQLSSPTSLDEVIVSGYTSKKRSKKDKGQSLMSIKAKSIQQIKAVGVKALGGEKKLNKTIRQQAKYLSVKSVLKGVSLQVSFTVEANGKPSNIRILNSASPVLDAEAIRLIELTEWEILPSHIGKGGSVTCQLKF